MLEIRPNCELCDRDLPPDSPDACICSYECTFCHECVEFVLKNVCPNCGGGLVQRPVRPSTERRPGVSRQHHPPSDRRVHTRYTVEEIEAFADQAKHIAPGER